MEAVNRSVNVLLEKSRPIELLSKAVMGSEPLSWQERMEIASLLYPFIKNSVLPPALSLLSRVSGCDFESAGVKRIVDAVGETFEALSNSGEGVNLIRKKILGENFEFHQQLELANIVCPLFKELASPLARGLSKFKESTGIELYSPLKLKVMGVAATILHPFSRVAIKYF